MPRMTPDSGLGWPSSDAADTAGLGWPRDASDGSNETSPAVDAEPAGLGDELPLASVIREDLAAVVSRETVLLPGESGDVSRETPLPAETGHVSRETEHLDGPAAVTPSSAAALWPRPASQRVFSIANQKGGVGKTTSTVNLAAALAMHGARVLVVDLDPQGNASTAFGVDHRGGTPSIYDVLVDGRPLNEVAREVEGVPGLSCAPATIDVAGAEIELVSVVARESRLAKAIAAMEQAYDYVFIDCPPSLGLLTVNALVAAAEVLIPIQCEFYALEGLSQLLKNIEMVRSHLNRDLHVSTILLTMYDGRTRLAEQVAQEVRTHFGELVIGATIPRSVRISEAPGYGQSVMTYDPASRGALAYADAAREIALRSAERAPGTPPIDAVNEWRPE